MKVRVEVVSLNTDGEEQRRQVLTIERQELAMETLGVNLTEGKALLAGVQDFVVAQQAREELEQRRAYPQCRRRYTTKDSGSTPVSTVFGRVEVLNPRWNRCDCQTEGPQTFRPMRTWLNGQTSPEMLYLETKWASLIPFARATDLLKEVLPVGDLVNAETHFSNPVPWLLRPLPPFDYPWNQGFACLCTNSLSLIWVTGFSSLFSFSK